MDCPVSQVWSLGCKLSYEETRNLLLQDQERLFEYMGDADSELTRRSFLAVILYRWAQSHYGNGRRTLGCLLWQLILTMTGADINPTSDLVSGLVLRSPLGITLFGVGGRNLTTHVQTTLGGSLSRRDICVGWGCPLLDDNVVPDGARVTGFLHIGYHARVAMRAILSSDLPAQTIASRPSKENQLDRYSQARHAKRRLHTESDFCCDLAPNQNGLPPYL